MIASKVLEVVLMVLLEPQHCCSKSLHCVMLLNLPPIAASGHSPLLTAFALLPEALKVSIKQERKKEKKKIE